MKNYERNTRVGCLNLMAIQKTPWRKAGYTLSLTHTNSPLSSSSLLFSLSFHPILLLFSLLSISFSLFSLSLLFSPHLFFFFTPYLPFPLCSYLFFPALRIHLILTWIRIRILGSTFGNSGSWSSDPLFRNTWSGSSDSL